jgi:Flp pilus assembly protein TadG
MQNIFKAPKPKDARVRRRGVVFVLLAIVLIVVIGMVGLAIDLSVAYFLKARLSQAADAAALAGARSLARGADLSTQTANAQAVATNFFNANFPNGYWGSTTSLLTPAVTENDTTKIRYVTVNATATVPTFFMRALGKNTVLVGTSAQAARRDANIMIILDRSGSMKNAVSQLDTSADWFVGQFAPGRDQVGLVTFGGTYNLVKPTTSFSPSVVNTINTLTSSTVYGTTNHAQPLWVAYQALAELNQPGALNAIVFFTDGQPNTITADWSTQMGTIANCNNGKTGSTWNPIIGYALTYTDGSTGGLFGTSTPLPPYQPGLSTSAGTVATAYVSAAYDKSDSTFTTERIAVTNHSGCQFWSDASSISSDLNGIPTSDYYGNQTAPTTNAYCGSTGSSCSAVALTNFDGTNLTAAAFNAGDYAAQRMRAGALNGIVPLVDTIALNTGSTPDTMYMQRLANSVNSSIYDSTKPTGIYVYASTTSDLQSAFVQIASQILHLSQ